MCCFIITYCFVLFGGGKVKLGSVWLFHILRHNFESLFDWEWVYSFPFEQGESRYFHTGGTSDKDMGEMAAVAMLAASPDVGFTRPIGAPSDDYNLAWFIFFLLGVGVLTPWNAFILAAGDELVYRQRDNLKRQEA